MSTAAVETTTVLSGATGFLGKALLARLLGRGHRVLALVRPAPGRTASARLASTLIRLFPDAAERRRAAARLDTLECSLGAGEARLGERVAAALDGRRARIVHGAASVAFDLPLDAARAVNVGGTDEILGVAETLAPGGQLEHLAYVSTAFVAGARNGVAYEDELDVGQDFTNSYERSKFEAEALVASRAGELPVSVFRPSIVAGDSVTGATTDFKVLYWPLAVLTRRLVPCIPGRADAAYDIVPVDCVADAMLWILDSCATAGRTYHLSSGRTIELRRLLAITAEVFRIRRLPPLVPPALFHTLLRPALHLCLRGRARQVMLSTGSVYVPYLSRSLAFDRRHAERALAGSPIVVPDTEAYVARLLGYAARTDFGRLAAGLPSAAGRREGLDPKALLHERSIDLQRLDGERGA